MAEPVDPGFAQAIVDYALGFEMMRGVLRRGVDAEGVEGLAERLGVGVDDVRGVLAGDWPARGLFDAGAEYARETDAERSVPVEAVAVNLLTDQFPADERRTMRRAFSAAVAGVFREHGYAAPAALAEIAGVERGEGKQGRYPGPKQ
jgi:hypothetical protein